jgi:hypothetical protein
LTPCGTAETNSTRLAVCNKDARVSRCCRSHIASLCNCCPRGCFIYISEDRPSEVRSADTGEASTMRVGSQNSVFLNGGVIPWDDLKVAIEKNYYVILVCGVDFEDVFFKQGEDRRIEDFAVRVVFNDPLKDPLGSIENQPVCEWRDMQLDVIRANHEQAKAIARSLIIAHTRLVRLIHKAKGATRLTTNTTTLDISPVEARNSHLLTWL